MSAEAPGLWRGLSVGARAAVIAAAVIVVIVIIVVSAYVNRDRNTPKYTPTEAACEMMRLGDSPDEALRAMKLMSGISDRVAADAVAGAVAQGC